MTLRRNTRYELFDKGVSSSQNHERMQMKDMMAHSGAESGAYTNIAVT